MKGRTINSSMTIASACFLCTGLVACGESDIPSGGGDAALESPAPAARDGSPGHRFRDCDDCPEMIVVPGGTFEMGSSRAEQDWSVARGRNREYTDRESPQHAVTFEKPFAVGVYEVTRGQFAAFVRETNHTTEVDCQTTEEADGKFSRMLRAERDWRNSGFPQDDSHPVVCLRWDDAIAYTRWLSAKTGKHYRLLSEAEWEYVARAGTTTFRFWGDDLSNVDACKFANIADNTPLPNGEHWPAVFDCTDGYWATAPVGSFQPNNFGVYDSLGNVWEWVDDCAHDSYAGAPSDGSSWHEGGNCENRILRGGALHEGGGFIRSAIRGQYSRNGRFSTDGFRVASDLTQ